MVRFPSTSKLQGRDKYLPDVIFTQDVIYLFKPLKPAQTFIKTISNLIVGKKPKKAVDIRLMLYCG
jgi:hypothetical protein